MAEAVRKGRRAEFPDAYADIQDVPPDPFAEQTFRTTVLDWGKLDVEPFASRLDLVRRLLQARQRYIMPWLAHRGMVSKQARLQNGLLRIYWHNEGAGTIGLLANLADTVAVNRLPTPAVAWIWGEAPSLRVPSWSVHCWLEPG